MTLIDRVIAIKQEALSQLPHGAYFSEVQQAEVLIAQVTAIIGGEEEAEPAAEPEEKA